MLGVLLVWAGSYGPHAVSNLPLYLSGPVAGKRVAMTTVGAACAAATALVIVSISSKGRCGATDAVKCGRAVLCALAAMAACCGSCQFEGAMAIGIVAALLNWAVCLLLQRIDVEDASGALSIHVAGGSWGLLAVGLLTSQQGYRDTVPLSDVPAYATGQPRSAYCNGVFYGGVGHQLTAQIVFILAIVSWAFLLTIAAVLPLRLLLPTEFQPDASLLLAGPELSSKTSRDGATTEACDGRDSRHSRELASEAQGSVSLETLQAVAAGRSTHTPAQLPPMGSIEQHQPATPTHAKPAFSGSKLFASAASTVALAQTLATEHKAIDALKV